MEPIVSHVEFKRSQMFSNSSTSDSLTHGCGFSQSSGAILASIKSNNEMPRYAAQVKIQTSNDIGERNEKRSGGCFTGFAYKILIPRVMKGIVKSTAVRRAYVIVRSQIARSAFWKSSSYNLYNQVITYSI